MGQRHQFYYKTRCYNNSDNNPEIISFHSQWCYGSMPLHRMKWLLEFNKKTDKYTKLGGKDNLGKTKDIFKCIISCNTSDGFYSHIIDVTDENKIKRGNNKGVTDPRRGDNNDGITVMDFTVKGKPVYAFVDILHDEQPYFLEPLTARDYALIYYKETDSEWEKFGIPKLIKYINRHARLLTVEELNALFPTMYAEMWKERKKLLKGNKKELPLLVATGVIKYASNKKFAENLLKEEAC